MPNVRKMVGPAYLLACLLLGGSIQGVAFVLLLQVTGILLIGWALLDRSRWHLRSEGRLLVMALAAIIGWALIQLIPLPPGLWTLVPGREAIADGYRLLGQPLPGRALSLSTDQSVSVLMTLVPPLAMATLILKARAYSRLGLVIALALATLVSIGLGFAQVTSGPRFYLYDWVSGGTPAGLFANSNHAAALMLVALPFVVAFAASRRTRAKKSADRAGPMLVAGTFALLLAPAIVFNGSLAVVLLALPAAAASALLFVPYGRVRLGRSGLLLAALLAIGAVSAVLGSRYGLAESGRVSIDSRLDIWSHTGRAIRDNWLTGTGLGTFPSVYHLYEDPVRVDRVYINHAHNEYLELVLELGLIGALLVALFVVAWARVAVAVWRSPGARAFARAATTAGAVLLLHSLVEFPIRTAALAALFGMTVALICAPDPAARAGSRPARHRRIEDVA